MAIINGTINADVITLDDLTNGIIGGVPSEFADQISGAAGNDLIDGAGGNDTLNGDADNDTVQGGAGNDLIDTNTSTASGNDLLLGGAGNDTLFAFGLDTIDGGADNDLIQVWSDQAYVLQGGAGTDTLSIASSFWLAGSAFSFQDNGIEIIQANGQEIYGGTSFGATTGDVLNFAGITFTGLDFIDGQGGNDTITGSSGADFIRGGTDNDSISGGNGADTLNGNAGNDTLIGGEGNDVLDVDTSAASGNDILLGEAGNDTLFAFGADTIDGGADDDLIRVWSDQAYVLQGGTGTDTLSIASSFWLAGSAFSLAGNGIEIIQANGQEIYGGASFGATTSDVLNFTGITVSGLDFIDGQGGNDTISGLSIAALIRGGADNDRIVAGGNNDTLRGDSGNDTLIGGNGNDILDGDTSNGAGDDSLVGGSGNDTLFAFGADTIRGDAGNDLIFVWSDRAYDIQGGGNSDTVSIVSSSWFIGSSFSLAGNGVESIQANGQEIYGGASFGANTADNLNFTGISVSGLDFIDGQAGNDTIQGLAGASRILGGANDDRIVGSVGNDTIRGDSGNDTLIGGNGNDIIDSDTSNGAGDDSLVGGSGNDTLFAFGADTIRGDGGNDLILVWSDRAYDIQGGADSDTISLASSSWFIGSSFSLAGPAGNNVENIQANGQEIYGGASFGANTADNLNFTGISVTGLDFIDGQAGNDTIQGLAGASRILGGGNDDLIVGGANNDTLFGDAGNDTLLAGDGNDILDSNSSNSAGGDSLVGGNGNDSIFALGNDTIRGDAGNDFIQVWSDQAYDIQGGDDIDTISLASSFWFIGSSFSLAGPAGNGVEIIQANGQEIYGGANFSAVTDDILDFTGITVTDLDFVSGQGGNDTIRGLAGSSRLLGGTGNDWVEGGTGNDTLRGDGGNDTLIGGNGNDILDSDTSNAAGDDSLVGGNGNDSIFALGNDTIRGDAGNDFIQVWSDRAYDIQGGDDSDTVSIVSSWWFIGSSFSQLGNGIESIQANGQEIYGGSTFSSTSNDSIDFSGLTIVGLDFVDAQGGDDLVAGSLADEDLRGGEGNDTLIGGGGNDTLRGGNGVDVFDGGTGIDTLDFSFTGTGGIIVLPTGVSTIGGVNESFTSIENVIGSSGGDNITGSDADNVLDGGFGNDAIRGGLGNDTISGGFGTNDLRGDGGVDTVDFRFLSASNGATINLATGLSTFTSGSSSIVEFENVLGGAGSDSITGTGEANRLDAFAGNDTILAGAGNDTLIGGLGADSLNGEGGIDLVDYSYALGGTINLTTGIADFGPTDIDSLALIEDVVGSEGRDTIIGSDLANRLDGGRSNDSIQGEGGADSLFGGLGADTLEGGLGNDFLDGGTGNDRLDGGDNNDSLIGGAGNDTLTGGIGQDAFRFGSPTEGTDVITDFASGTDRIQARSSTFGGLALGTLAAGNFRLSGQALPAAPVFIYNGATGTLSFDANGSGAGVLTTLATLTGLPSLLASDIQIVAS
jgi:Ca2+-binding RTX toxin-like protein